VSNIIDYSIFQAARPLVITKSNTNDHHRLGTQSGFTSNNVSTTDLETIRTSVDQEILGVKPQDRLQMDGVSTSVGERNPISINDREPSSLVNTVTEPEILQSSSRTELHNTNKMPQSNNKDIHERPSTPPNSTTVRPSTLVTPPTPTQVSPQQSLANLRGKGTPSIEKVVEDRDSTPKANPEQTKSNNPPSITGTPPLGFLSSVFSAAQTAASSLGNTFQSNHSKTSLATADKSNNSNTHKRSVSHPQGRSMPFGQLESSDVSRVRTDSDVTGPSPMTSSFDQAEAARTNMPNRIVASRRFDELSSSRVINGVNPVTSDKSAVDAIINSEITRPASVSSSHRSLNVDPSPARVLSAFLDHNNEVKRSSSIRSRLSDRKKGRKRGSSTGTANTLGNATTPSLGSAIGPRTTGYAVASSKRNKDFHLLFRSVPEDDYLIEDYSAALQRDILLHGRFYVSEGHVCFASNLLGWVTNLVISFDEIVAIEKKNTAIVFPNALVIQTLHSRNVFASFVTRDSTFDLLYGIWRTTHANLKLTAHGVTLDDTVVSAKSDKRDSTGSTSDSDGDSDDVYDEDADHDEDINSVTEGGGTVSAVGSDPGDFVPTSSRHASAVTTGTVPQPAKSNIHAPDFDPSSPVSVVRLGERPGPLTHEATECTDAASHYERQLIDTTINAPLGKIYTLIFGPQSSTFMRKFLIDDQKSREVVYEDSKTGLDEVNKTFTFSYIKPLNAPVGPRQTRCLVTSQLLSFDLNQSVSVDVSCQTPDVPSGNIFVTKTRYCLMWGPNNSTRFLASCAIEWSGKSWLKGPIEKGANDGQSQYMKDLVASLNLAVATRSASKMTIRNRKGKTSRKEDENPTDQAANRVATSLQVQEENWGLFDPLRPSLGPLISFLRPFFTPQIVISVLFVLLVQSWFFNLTPRGSKAALKVNKQATERTAAYDVMWAREEADLWDWLEERVGVDPADGIGVKPSMVKKSTKKTIEDERWKEKEISHAIKSTEEKLQALKEKIGEKKVSIKK